MRDRLRLPVLQVGIDHYHDGRACLTNIRRVRTQKHGHRLFRIGEYAQLAVAERRQLPTQHVRLANLFRKIEITRLLKRRAAIGRRGSRIHVVTRRKLEAHRHHDAVAGGGGAAQRVPVGKRQRRRVVKSPGKARSERTSGQAMTVPISRNISCSSTNQGARPSHHGSEENVAEKPSPRRAVTSDQASPGVQARKRQSGKVCVTEAMMWRQTGGGTA